MMSSSPGWQLWQQDLTVQEYLRLGDDAIPSRRDQIRVMLSLVKFSGVEPLHVLDLGCGDAILLEALLRAFPQTQRAIAVDGSPGMLERAVNRLRPYGDRVECFLTDLSITDLRASVSSGLQFDVVVSGFAIHHLEDARKQEIYQQVYDLLKSPGIFINIEHVKSHSSRGEEQFEAWFIGHLIEIQQARGDHQTPEEIAHNFTQRPGKLANRLAPLETQLEWLRAIGFTDVDCFWKFYELAVFAGCRS